MSRCYYNEPFYNKITVFKETSYFITISCEGSAWVGHFNQAYETIKTMIDKVHRSKYFTDIHEAFEVGEYRGKLHVHMLVTRNDTKSNMVDKHLLRRIIGRKKGVAVNINPVKCYKASFDYVHKNLHRFFNKNSLNQAFQLYNSYSFIN